MNLKQSIGYVLANVVRKLDEYAIKEVEPYELEAIRLRRKLQGT